MKKTLIVSLVLSTLLITGCNEKQEQRPATENTTVAQSAQQSSVPAIFTHNKVLFKKQETLTLKPAEIDPEFKENNGNGEPLENGPRTVEMDWNISTLETGVDWLDALLLKQTQGETADFEKSYNEEREQILQETDYASSVEFSQSTSFMGQREKIATFIFDTYFYSGGAHGMPSTSYLNIDLTTKQPILLSDIFAADKMTQVKNALWEAYRAENEETFIEKKDFSVPEQFYFTLEGIRFVYQPYEIGSFAEGFKELGLGWWQIGNWVKPEFKQKNYYSIPTVTE